MTFTFPNLRRRLFASLTLCIVAALLISVTATAQSARLNVPDHRGMIEALKDGGHILLIRHERTEFPSRPDDYSEPHTDCRVQRNLSVAGAVGAQETGIILRALDIPIGRVLTSPMCRSAETARYMFGVEYELEPALMHHDTENGRTLQMAADETRQLLASLSPEDLESNIALVTHGGHVLMVSGIYLSEGELAILKLDETGGVTVVGQFDGSDFAGYARRIVQAE